MASATINALYDTYIRKSSPGTNYEGDDYMVLGKVGTGNQIDRILLDIPLSAVSGKIITSATLYLYQVYSSYAYTNTISFGIHRIYEDWSPGSVTWGSMPGYSSTAREAASLSGNSSGWRNFDIAGLIQDIIHNDRSYEGLMIRQLDEDVGNTRKNFSTAEVGKRPYLVVGYIDGGIWAKNGGIWKRGQIYAKNGGVWKQGILYAKNGGVWKQGI
jgi:hypothetical protein